MKNGLLALLGIGVLIVLSVLVNGWVAAVLWGWFVVPLFGLPAINIAQACGVGMTINMLTGQKSTQKTDDWASVMATAFFVPLLLLGVGWIVHLFV
jgi:hypothetical protein